MVLLARKSLPESKPAMTSISLCTVSEANWRATLQLTVHPDQQRLIADYVPIAAIALAKAFIRPGGLVWEPYAIYADRALVGFVELAYTRNSRACYWIYHFFIDYIHQGKGYGTRALQQLITLVTACNPDCQQIKLTVHPENHRAQLVYTRVGFHPTGEAQDGEPVYVLQVRNA
jgi:diamine N-acetyltransferase